MNIDEMPNQTIPVRAVVDREADSNERTIAVILHLATMFQMVGLILQFILWRMKHNESPFLDDHAREAINFHLSMIIWLILAGLLTVICIGAVLLPILGITAIVAPIVMAVRANRGEYIRYPITIRFL